MTHSSTPVRIASVVAGLHLLAASEAAAYIDPGSGSFFVQAMLASLLAVGMAIKAYWRRIVAFFVALRSKFRDQETP